MNKIPSIFGFLAFFFVAGCATGGLEKQVLNLTEQQARIEAMKDSLAFLLGQSNQELTAKSLQYDEAMEQEASLEASNKSLRSTLYSRTEELKKSQLAYGKLDSALSLTVVEKETLRQEILRLKAEIARAEAETSEEIKANDVLTESLKAEEKKRHADSVALAGMKLAALQRAQETGFIHIAEVGGALGLGRTDDLYAERIISLDYILGYQATRNFMTGLGTGVNFYNGGTMIPLYADIRYFFNARKNAPFVTADGGVLLSLDRFDNSGIFINPQFGVRRELNSSLYLHLTGGFLSQFAPENRHSYINIKAGVSFRGK